MEKRLYEAAVKGNVSSLLNLLQDDGLLLDRFTTGHYPETPLHVASMLGHLEFLDEVLSRKPELARELDSRKSSPLHLAAAKGYLEIVKRLLKVNPDMCLVCDVDGRNPLHIAAIKGNMDVLRVLVEARPWAARLVMDGGDTILHGCVRYNQLEAMKLLVERVSDHEFVNCKNYDGNSILHLAVADKQTETIYFLISSTTIEVNCENLDGFTPLDILSQNKRNLKDMEIVEALRSIEAKHGKAKFVSDHQLKAIRTKILSLPPASNPTNSVSKPKKNKARKRFLDRNAEWLERKRDTLMLVASLLAAMAFQVGVNPPSGVWQDTTTTSSQDNSPSQAPNGFMFAHKAGSSIMADNFPGRYTFFLISNTTGFISSLSIILLLISGLPVKRRFFMWILMAIMWIAITAMALTYLASVTAFTPDHQYPLLKMILSIPVLVWIGLMLLLLLGHAIRLTIWLIKALLRFLIRLINAHSTPLDRA